jgi:hypothetical protein
MHLVEVFMPVRLKTGIPVPQEEFLRLRGLLVETFGGLTEFSRVPARGLWKNETQTNPESDDIVVYEVMAETLDRSWWRLLREHLEERLGQDWIVVRAHEIEQL